VDGKDIKPVPDGKGTLGAGLAKSNPALYEARLNVRRMRDCLVGIHTNYAEFARRCQCAYEHDEWKLLGYATWEGYLANEFSETAFPRLGKDKRDEVVAALSSDGMPTRAIAAVLSISKSTVHNIITATEAGKPGAQNGTPEPGKQPVAQNWTTGPPKVKTLGGKSYPKHQAKPALNVPVSSLTPAEADTWKQLNAACVTFADAVEKLLPYAVPPPKLARGKAIAASDRARAVLIKLGKLVIDGAHAEGAA
jgi:hypothetical protein